MTSIIDASLKAIEHVFQMQLLGDNASLQGFKESAHVAIEDARHDAKSGTWTIGVGFVRPWDRLDQLGELAPLLSDRPLHERRTVTHVLLDDDTGELIAYF